MNLVEVQHQPWSTLVTGFYVWRMARPLRVAFAGALYHLIARGNRRAAIFEYFGEADYAAVAQRPRSPVQNSVPAQRRYGAPAR